MLLKHRQPSERGLIMDAVKSLCIEERLTLPQIEQESRHTLITYALKYPSQERNQWFARIRRWLSHSSLSEDACKRSVKGQVI
jgi:hypothetical protein